MTKAISQEELIQILRSLNKQFNDDLKIKDTYRSLFLSGIMIALKDSNFRKVYKNVQMPSKGTKKEIVLEAQNLNNLMLDSITEQLEDKVNNHSKEYSWRDTFSFIKNVDYSLSEYKAIIEKVESKIFTPFINNEKHDILGKAYKIFLEKAGKVENKNIILTPDHIKNLMIDLADLNTNDVVLDTCTGTGGFLMSAMNDMINKANNNESVIKNIKETQLIGFELDPVLFLLACTNMFLHGDGRPNIVLRSCLIEDSSEGIVGGKNLLEYVKSLKPTKCIINPPYENNNPIKFSIQAIDYLEANGKLIVIMPTPTLRKNQNDLTKELLGKATLDFVIKMPYNLFNEQKRTVNTSIFGFTKKPHNNLNEVMYYYLEDDGFVSVQRKGKIDIDDKWDSIKESVLDSIVNKKEIPEISEKRKIYKDGLTDYSGFKNESNKNTSMVKVKDIFDIEKGTLQSTKAEDGVYDFVTADDVWKKHNEYTHERECLVYVNSSSGSLGKSHYVNGKFIASDLCLILTPKIDSQYPVNLKFYNNLFASKRKQIKRDLADGASKLTIREDNFKEYYIEYFDIDTQNQFVKNFIKPYEIEKKRLEKYIKDGMDKINNGMCDLLQ